MYLYHRVPNPMHGNTLMPLTVLEKTYPDLGVEIRKKYQGREEVLEQRLELLDCLWNDVLHFSPIHPSLIREAYERSGGQWKEECFFEIPVERISQESTIIHQSEWQIEDGVPVIKDKEVEYRPELLESLREVGAATIHHYKRSFERGQQPFLFAFVPHILCAEKVSVDGLSVLTI